MGRFLGIRIDGRLAAMAGERMRMAGYTEVSGVCTQPDFRGRGLAGRLSAAVAATIAVRGDSRSCTRGRTICRPLLSTKSWVFGYGPTSTLRYLRGASSELEHPAEIGIQRHGGRFER